jgi:hypothetical protein
MNMPTGDQLMGILRAFIPGVVALATYYGLGNSADDTIVATMIATGIVAVWSNHTNSQTSMIHSVNAADNGVKVVANTTPAPQENAPIPALTHAAEVSAKG